MSHSPLLTFGTLCEQWSIKGVDKWPQNRSSPWSCQRAKSEQLPADLCRTANSEYRKREHLTAAEIDKLIEAAKGNRHGHRDATMILVAYRHGLRASEICELRWEDLNFAGATLNVSRKKSGTDRKSVV